MDHVLPECLPRRLSARGPGQHRKIVRRTGTREVPKPAYRCPVHTAGAAAFIGRERERDILAEEWAGAVDGQRRTVLIDAPAGFGKTCLLAELLRRTAGSRLLLAAGEADEAHMPFGVLAQLLRGWHGVLPARLYAVAGNKPADVMPDPLVVGAELLAALDGAGQDPILIAVDDAHSADSASLRAIAFALRRLRGAPIMTVLTCPTERVEALPAVVRRLVADEGIRLSLAPFTDSDAAALARALGHGEPSSPAARGLVEHTAGSPLLMRAVLDELARSRTALEDGELPVPASYARLVAARLARCPVDAAALVRAAAILDTPRPLATVAAVASVPEPLTALDGALAAGLLQPPGPDGLLRLEHPLARSAVRDAVPPGQRVALHRAAAGELAAVDTAAALRHRILATTGTDEELATELAERAAAELARGAGTQAAVWLRAAIRVSSASETADRYRLMLVESVTIAADVAAEPELRAELQRLPRTALQQYLLARLRTAVGDLPGARDHAREAWQLIAPHERADADLRARVAAELARTNLTLGHAGETIEWAERALAAAPDSPATADCAGGRLIAMAVRGDYEQALAAFGDTSPVVAHATFADFDTLIPRGLISLWRGDLAQANRDLRAVSQTTRRSGPVHLHLGVTAYLADLAYRAGDWERALNEAETGIALALDLDHIRTLPMLHAAAALPYAARGEFEAAQRHVTAAVHAADTVGDMQTRLWANHAAAWLAAGRGQPAAVLTALAALSAMSDLDGVRDPGLQPWQCLFASALAYAGRSAEAERVLTETERRAHRCRQPAPLLAVHRTRAEIALAAGRIAEAEAHLLAGKAYREATASHRFELARFDLVRGSVQGSAGDRTAAEATLSRVISVFDDLQAAPWAERARAVLDGRGPTPRAERPRLSPAEATIARLVASGMTNKEIAAELVVSVKTVEYHLSRTYAKLGLRSRVQLAARIAGETPAGRVTDLHQGGAGEFF